MNREFAAPGYVAVALAILFPIYWFSGLFTGLELSLTETFRADVTRLSAMDGLFVLIGLMEVYIYVSLRRLLQQKLHGGLAGGLSLGMAIAVGLFTATVLFDVFLALGPELSGGELDRMIMAAVLASVVLSVLVGLVGLILSVALIFLWGETGVMLKLFAVLLLVCSLLTMTVLFAPMVWMIYPVALVLLAVVFLRGGGEVEVV